MRSMTADTPTHRKRVELLDSLHGFYGPVARLTANRCRDMATVIKDHVVWQIVYFEPLDRLILSQCRRDLLNLRRVLQNLRVAIHASTRRGNAGNFRLVRGGVTVKALNLVIARVNLV